MFLVGSMVEVAMKGLIYDNQIYPWKQTGHTDGWNM